MAKKSHTTHFPKIVLVGSSFVLLESWATAVPVRPHWRLWWNLDLGAGVSHGDTMYRLCSDKLVLVPPHVKIGHHLSKPVRSLSLHLEINESMDPHLNEVFYPDIPQSLYDRLHLLTEALGDTSVMGENGVHLLLGEVVCRAFQLLPDSIWSVPRMDPRIESCIGLMRASFGSGLTNDQLAAHVCISKNAFVRLFTGNVGISPQAYLQNLRLDRAAIMLEQSDATIEGIAEECGFCDRNYLSKLFKRRFGVGPAHYRKQGG